MEQIVVWIINFEFIYSLGNSFEDCYVITNCAKKNFIIVRKKSKSNITIDDSDRFVGTNPIIVCCLIFIMDKVMYQWTNAIC